jgi:hypothetical protein
MGGIHTLPCACRNAPRHAVRCGSVRFVAVRYGSLRFVAVRCSSLRFVAVETRFPQDVKFITPAIITCYAFDVPKSAIGDTLLPCRTWIVGWHPHGWHPQASPRAWGCAWARQFAQSCAKTACGQTARTLAVCSQSHSHPIKSKGISRRTPKLRRLRLSVPPRFRAVPRRSVPQRAVACHSVRRRADLEAFLQV